MLKFDARRNEREIGKVRFEAVDAQLFWFLHSDVTLASDLWLKMSIYQKKSLMHDDDSLRKALCVGAALAPRFEPSRYVHILME